MRGRNIFAHGKKVWVNSYVIIVRGHHVHIIMDGISVLPFMLVLG